MQPMSDDFLKVDFRIRGRVTSNVARVDSLGTGVGAGAP
jgi:hypothetical protein